MPYLIVLDDKLRKLDLPPKDLSDILFKISPPRTSGGLITIVNVELIMIGPTQLGGWAAVLGIIHDVDAEPFVLVPLNHGCMLGGGWKDFLGISPGQLTLEIKDIYPSGRKEPEPKPFALLKV